MDSAFSILPKVLRKRGLQSHADASLVTYRAKDWLAERFPALLEVITIKEFANGILVIECSHSIALQECQAAIPDLRQYLASECAFAKIQSIRVVRL